MKNFFEQTIKLFASKAGVWRLLFLSAVLFTITAYVVTTRISDNADETAGFTIAGICVTLAFLLMLLGFYYFFSESDRSRQLSVKLQQQTAQLHTILSSLSEGLITTNKKGEIVYANAAAERVSGWKYGEMKDQPIEKVFLVTNETTGMLVENIVTHILSSGEAAETSNYSLLQTKDEKQRIITNSGVPLLDDNGNINGAVLLFNDETKNSKTENKLRHTEKQLFDIMRNLPQAIYTCDEKGYILAYNKAAEELWGRKPVLGQDKWYDGQIFLNIDDTTLAAAEHPVALSLRDKKQVLGNYIKKVRPDGSFRIVKPCATPLFNTEGVLTGVVNMLIDVTEKLERETLAKQTEEKYSMIINEASDAILIYTFDGVIHDFNKSTCTQLGYTPEEFKKLTASDLLFDGPVMMNMNIVNKINDGETTLFTRKIKRKDGSYIIAEMSSKKMPDGKVLSVVRDITVRVNAERELKGALELYDLMAEATSDTIWDWDIVNQKMKYNKGILKMFGYNVTEVGDAQEWWMRNVHPDDNKRIEGLTEKAFEDKKQTLQLEYRYRCANNSYKNIFDRAFIIYDESGKPIRMIGAMQDITYQREEEMHINKAIIDTQEVERQQMGMELHDNVNQILSAALIYLSTLSHFDAKEESYTETLKLGKKLVLEAIGEIRRLSHQLAPASFEKISIKDVILSLMETIKATDRYETNLRFTGDIRKIKGEIRINLYRILQEQMNNITKYAEATKLEVSVEVVNKTVKLRVFDNGKGFDPRTVKRGIGLENIKRRVNLYDGRFTLNTSPGNGCEIIAVLPIKDAKRA
jgi:two-component system, NarL family, sensor histidine kinase UhpB